MKSLSSRSILFSSFISSKY